MANTSDNLFTKKLSSLKNVATWLSLLNYKTQTKSAFHMLLDSKLLQAYIQTKSMFHLKKQKQKNK